MIQSGELNSRDLGYHSSTLSSNQHRINNEPTHDYQLRSTYGIKIKWSQRWIQRKEQKRREDTAGIFCKINKLDKTFYNEISKKTSIYNTQFHQRDISIIYTKCSDPGIWQYL